MSWLERYFAFFLKETNRVLVRIIAMINGSETSTSVHLHVSQ